MAIVLHRTTRELRESVSTPDYDPATWVVLTRGDSRITTLRTLLASGVPTRHIAIRAGDALEEMTAGEKAAVESAQARIVAQSDAAGDVDGTPAADANGVAVHTIQIRKRGPGGGLISSGSEVIRVIPETLTPTSTGSVTLSSGGGSFTVGPTLQRGEMFIRLIDQAGNLRPFRIRVRFK